MFKYFVIFSLLYLQILSENPTNKLLGTCVCRICKGCEENIYCGNKPIELGELVCPQGYVFCFHSFIYKCPNIPKECWGYVGGACLTNIYKGPNAGTTVIGTLSSAEKFQIAAEAVTTDEPGGSVNGNKKWYPIVAGGYINSYQLRKVEGADGMADSVPTWCVLHEPNLAMEADGGMSEKCH